MHLLYEAIFNYYIVFIYQYQIYHSFFADDEVYSSMLMLRMSPALACCPPSSSWHCHPPCGVPSSWSSSSREASLNGSNLFLGSLLFHMLLSDCFCGYFSYYVHNFTVLVILWQIQNDLMMIFEENKWWFLSGQMCHSNDVMIYYCFISIIIFFLDVFFPYIHHVLYLSLSPH